MSENEKRERFGRYLILDHLVDGGMAKICRARFLSDQADKIVAIKMVQPQYSQDEAFKTMFMDEIKLTFGLIHPNIVQTYDYGLHKGQLFVAMEYCDGRNLKEYLDKLKERKFVFPVEISTYIITQVCQGLHYAHTYTDKLTGKSSNIIHRDISPHNLMLTYDGTIKVIDFGIAKADTNSESTQAGTIKGKLSYLAPEYLEGEELDPRYDQFAVGITLWEMLCSRKLFKASNDLAVLKKVQECKVPAPSSINPNVPKELDQIILKALSKDRNKRFENMDKFNRALMKFLYTNYPDFNATDLSYFAKELFKKEIKQDREKLFEYGKIDLRPYLEELKNENSGNSSESITEGADNLKQRQTERVLDFGFDEKESNTASRRRLGKKKPVNIEEKFSHLNDGTMDINLDGGDTPSNEGNKDISRPGKADSTSLKSSKTKSIARKKTGTRTVARSSRRGTETKVKKKKSSSSSDQSKVKIIAASFVAAFVFGYFIFSGDSGPGDYVADNTLQTSSERSPSSSSTSNDKAVLHIINFNQHSQSLYINGKLQRPGVLGDVSVPANEEFSVRVQTPGRQHYVTYFTLAERESRRIEVPEMPRASYGYIVMSRPCVNGELIFELFGEKRSETLPLSLGRGIGFPVSFDRSGRAVASDHTVYVRRDGEEIEREVKFTISGPDDSIDLCRHL